MRIHFSKLFPFDVSYKLVDNNPTALILDKGSIQQRYFSFKDAFMGEHSPRQAWYFKDEKLIYEADANMADANMYMSIGILDLVFFPVVMLDCFMYYASLIIGHFYSRMDDVRATVSIVYCILYMLGILFALLFFGYEIC